MIQFSIQLHNYCNNDLLNDKTISDWLKIWKRVKYTVDILTIFGVLANGIYLLLNNLFRLANFAR